MHTRETPQFVEQARQFITQRQRQKVFGTPSLGYRASAPSTGAAAACAMC